jgi:hypothetical protein
MHVGRPGKTIVVRLSLSYPPKPVKHHRRRSRTGRGLVHFSARKRILWINGRPKTWTCPLPAAQGGQSHFRGGQSHSRRSVLFAAKIGTVPWERLQHHPELTIMLPGMKLDVM